VLVALVPIVVALHVPALGTLALMAALLVALIAFEAVHFAAARERIRHELAREPVPE
jgi:hypothetical protein